MMCMCNAAETVTSDEWTNGLGTESISEPMRTDSIGLTIRKERMKITELGVLNILKWKEECHWKDWGKHRNIENKRIDIIFPWLYSLVSCQQVIQVIQVNMELLFINDDDDDPPILLLQKDGLPIDYDDIQMLDIINLSLITIIIVVTYSPLHWCWLARKPSVFVHFQSS